MVLATVNGERVAPPPQGLNVTVRTGLSGSEGSFQMDFHTVIGRGEFVALCGPSGAGKTTLLRMIAGLRVPDEGRIALDGELWSDSDLGFHRAVRHRSIGFVFQDYALFPNMTAAGNIEYALRDMPRKARREEALDLLEMVGLAPLANAMPARMSGGQRQRLALIRALARRPALLMLDEPLSALDPDLREKMRELLASLHEAFGATTLMVSHDPAEVDALADRVIRVRRGRIVSDESILEHRLSRAMCRAVSARRVPAPVSQP